MGNVITKPPFSNVNIAMSGSSVGQSPSNLHLGKAQNPDYLAGR